VTTGQTYSFQPAATDPSGQPLAFGIANKPAWAAFSTSTGRLSGTPAATDAGTYANIVISVSDVAATAALPGFTIVVQPSPPPTIAGAPATSVTSGQRYSFQPATTHPSGLPLAFGIANKPGWATFSTSTGLLSGTPAATDAGTYANIVISTSDGVNAATLPAFSIVVIAYTPPTIAGVPATNATTGQAYSFQPTATDPSGQPLVFSIANKPAWASFSTSTGQLSGTPAATDAGTYASIVISVSDGTATATLPAFSIQVSAPVTGTVTLTWTAPTQNDDGTPLTNLAGYKLRYGTSATGLTQLVDIPNPTITSASIESLSAGTWYFTLSSYTTAGVESVPTGEVSTVVN